MLAVDDEGNTALHYHAKRKFSLSTPFLEQANDCQVSFLIKRGVDPLQKNIHGQTARDISRNPVFIWCLDRELDKME